MITQAKFEHHRFVNSEYALEWAHTLSRMILELGEQLQDGDFKPPTHMEISCTAQKQGGYQIYFHTNVSKRKV